MFKRLIGKFTKEDFLSINDFVRLQYEKSAKYEHTILRFITGMEVFMFIFGFIVYNHQNPRAVLYLTLYALLAAASLFTDLMITVAEKKHAFRTSKLLAFVGYFYFAFIVAWGLIITTLDVTHGGSYWVAATIMMAISVFLNLNPFYTCSVMITGGIYLCFLCAQKEGGFTDRMMNIIIFIFIDCAIILNNYFIHYNNAYMEHKLALLSTRDGLTGVNNRLALENREKEESDIRVESVAIIDIDDFKTINDTGGHSLGDEALLRLTSLFREFFKDREIYRYGGDEFVILSESDSEVTTMRLQAVNNRLKNSYDDKMLHISGGIVEHGTGSIGDAVKAADDFLYEAKKKGKGQIICK